MKSWVLIDGRPAQGRPRGMGIYVLRLVKALSELAGEDLAWKVALDEQAGADPWEGAVGECLWSRAKHVAHWEQNVLPALAEKHGAALVHHTANASAWNARVPHVVTIHDAIFLRSFFGISDHWYPRQLAAHLYYRYGVNRGAQRARLVLTDSEYSRSQLVDKLNLKKDKVISIPLAEPHPVATLSESDLAQSLEELQVERPYILGLGAIDKRKNTANLVRAFARLPRSAASQLVLAGFEKIKHSNVMELIEEWHLEPRVRIFGYLPDKQLTALFQGAAVFAYPSLDEGFGLPILQAFLMGIPVVTTQFGSIAEVAGQAARYANPKDPRHLSQELMTVLTDPSESHRLAYAGYLQAKHFSWETTARRTREAYQRALGGGQA